VALSLGTPRPRFSSCEAPDSGQSFCMVTYYSVLASFELRTVNYLLKPVRPGELKAAVAKAIKGREGA